MLSEYPKAKLFIVKTIHFAQSVFSWFHWIGWKYIGVIMLLASFPAWPWILYLYRQNLLNGPPDGAFGTFMLDWGKQPKPGCSKQKLMYDLAMFFRPWFEFSLECICRND